MTKKNRGQASAEKAKRRKDRKSKAPGRVKVERVQRDIITDECLKIVDMLFSGAGAMPIKICSSLEKFPEYVANPLSRLALTLNRFLHEGAGWPYSLEEVKQFESKFTSGGKRGCFIKVMLLSFGSDDAWIAYLDENHWPYTYVLPDGLSPYLNSFKVDELGMLALPIILTHASSLKNPGPLIKRVVAGFLTALIDDHCTEFTLEPTLRQFLKIAALNPLKPNKALIKLEKILGSSYDFETTGVLEVISSYLARCRQLRQSAGISDLDWHGKFPKVSERLLRIDPATILSGPEFLADGSISADPIKWDRFFSARINVDVMSAEDSFRFNVLRAKLFCHLYHRSGQEEALRLKMVHHLEKAFEGLSPSSHLGFVKAATNAFFNFYIRSCIETSTFLATLPLTKKMLEIQPNSWNLAVLCFVGDVMLHGKANSECKSMPARALAQARDDVFYAACEKVADFPSKSQAKFYDDFVASLSVLEQEHLLDVAFTTNLAQGVGGSVPIRKLLTAFVLKSHRLIDRYRAGAFQKSSFKYICAWCLASNGSLTIQNTDELSLLLGQHNRWLSVNIRMGKLEDNFIQRVLVFMSEVSNPIAWLTVFLEQIPASAARYIEGDIIAFLRVIKKRVGDFSVVSASLLRIFPGEKMHVVLGLPGIEKKAKPKKQAKVISSKNRPPLGEFERFWTDSDR